MNLIQTITNGKINTIFEVNKNTYVTSDNKIIHKVNDNTLVDNKGQLITIITGGLKR